MYGSSLDITGFTRKPSTYTYQTNKGFIFPWTMTTLIKSLRMCQNIERLVKNKTFQPPLIAVISMSEKMSDCQKESNRIILVKSFLIQTKFYIRLKPL